MSNGDDSGGSWDDAGATSTTQADSDLARQAMAYRLYHAMGTPSDHATQQSYRAASPWHTNPGQMVPAIPSPTMPVRGAASQPVNPFERPGVALPSNAAAAPAMPSTQQLAPPVMRPPTQPLPIWPPGYQPYARQYQPYQAPQVPVQGAQAPPPQPVVIQPQAAQMPPIAGPGGPPMPPPAGTPLVPPQQPNVAQQLAQMRASGQISPGQAQQIAAAMGQSGGNPLLGGMPMGESVG